MKQVLEFAQQLQPDRLDITGGAPELHPHLCSFIESARHIINHIQVRTNLTVLKQPKTSSTLKYFRDNQVKLIASLPCYELEEVDSQRGSGVFHTSIHVLQHLNHLGYGLNPKLQLDLVYNPEGAFLPPPQSRLETTYREILSEKHNIVFNRLLTITNMPIGRFYNFLEQSHQQDHYFKLLRSSFNPLTLEYLMCRHQIHVGPTGQVYDCDFNFALDLPSTIFIDDLSKLSRQTLLSREIVTGDHCYGCTAGSGSSCEGALDS
jgi:radical SAM/Cys-rich protein